MDINTRLNHLETAGSGINSYAWYMTKQSIDFIEQCKLVSILDNYQRLNNDEKFSDFRTRFNLTNGDNYRKYINSSLLGLTKNGHKYKDYEITDVYYEIMRKCEGNLDDRNSFEDLIESQIEKIYYPVPFYDSFTNHLNNGYGLFITFYLYKIFIELINKTENYTISKIEYKTFIATSKQYSDWEDTVKMIIEYRKDTSIIQDIHKKNTKDLRLISIYKNLRFFEITKNDITLKKEYLDIIKDKVSQFEDSMYYTLKYNDETIHDYLKILFSTSPLITPPNLTNSNNHPSNKIIVENEEYLIDEEYTNDIYSLDFNETNINLSSNASTPPILSTSSGRKYKTNPYIGRNFIASAKYQCQFDSKHFSYISKRTNKMYVESHHLIPMCMQDYFWDTHKINLDTPENLVSLCPLCHGILHKGLINDRNEILKVLYEKKKELLENIGIYITIDDLIRYYDLKKNC